MSSVPLNPGPSHRAPQRSLEGCSSSSEVTTEWEAAAADTGPFLAPHFLLGPLSGPLALPSKLNRMEQTGSSCGEAFSQEEEDGHRSHLSLSAQEGGWWEGTLPLHFSNCPWRRGPRREHRLCLQSPAMPLGFVAPQTRGEGKGALKSCVAPRGWEIQLGPFRYPHQLSPPPLSSNSTRHSTRNPPTLGRLHSARPLSS